MSHCITAIILKGNYDKEIAGEYDLIGKELGFNLTLFHIDHYYSAYWQFKLGKKGYLQTLLGADRVIFPHQVVVADLMKIISKNTVVIFAIIATGYFGGTGNQFATVYKNETLISEAIVRINQALQYLGVVRTATLDEFDTVGLGAIRSLPEGYLDKYGDLCEAHNL